MNEITLEYLKNLYSNLPGNTVITKNHSTENIKKVNEETVKGTIVINFLKMLGYKEEWFHYEYPMYDNKKRVDISVNINGNKKNMFFIEVKKSDDILALDSQTQLTNYMNHENIEWGMLTNGVCYILFNNGIKAKSYQKEVLRFYLNSPNQEQTNGYKFGKRRNENNLKYFSYDYLYNKKVTNYFKYMTEYINSSHSNGSCSQYKSTIYNFLDYISESFNKFDLNFINEYYFKKFILYTINTKKDTPKSPKSKDTIISKYAYIRGFCEMLKVNKEILNNPFSKLSEDEILKDIEFNETQVDFVPLSNEEISTLFKSYNNTQHTLRNQIILLLFLYLGIDIKDIKNLKDTDIDFYKKTININNRILPLPDKLNKMINDYKTAKKQNKIKCNYLICGKYKGTYRQLNDTNFNDIITKQFLKFNVYSKRKNKVTTSFIKSCVIKSLYKNGISIEELSQFTGLTLSSIEAYIDLDNKAKKINLKKIIDKHPYKNFLIEQ